MAQQNEIKGLAKDTAIYGISSIVGKFLNWLLVPLYTFTLKEQGDYGIVTNLYAWTALLLVILTYGMETGFFRFANKEGENPQQVFFTSITCLFSTSLLFSLCCIIFSQPIANALGYGSYPEFTTMMFVCVSIDAFATTAFSYLRYQKRPIQFAILKVLFVVLNIGFNLFFLVLCPKISDWSIISAWYRPDYGVGYVFISNVLATVIQTLFLLPTIVSALRERDKTIPAFSFSLLGRLLRYSLPLLVLGIAGIMNQTLDKLIFPYIHPAILSTAPDATIQSELGIYGACFKIAVVMMMFSQAFRYAYEPFVFSKHKDRNSVQTYADVMKYYILFSFLILLGMVVYLDVLKLLINHTYWDGLVIVPIVLWTYIFQGIYMNLSFWYKLADKTYYGAIFSLIGLIITAGLQIWLVPTYGYIASAFSGTVCYFVIMLISYLVGRKYLDVPYDLKSIGGYTLLTIGILGVYYGVKAFATAWLTMLIGTLLLLVYCYVLIKKDFPLSSLPVVGKYFRK